MTLQIIQRSQWGARYPDGCTSAPLPARYLWLHHSTTVPPPPDASLTSDMAAVRLLEDIGQQRFGCGISYTFAVAPSGRCFEGHSISRQGTHTLNHNDDSRAVVLIGSYDTRPPTEAQLATVAELTALGRASGWWTSWLSGGHRDAEVSGYTECPGDAAEAAISEINRRALSGQFGGDVPTLQEIHDDLAKMLADPYHSYLPPVHAKLDALAGAVAKVAAAQAAQARQLTQLFDQINPALIAEKLAPLLPASVEHLSEADLAAVATAVADEQARRQVS